MMLYALTGRPDAFDSDSYTLKEYVNVLLSICKDFTAGRLEGLFVLCCE